MIFYETISAKDKSGIVFNSKYKLGVISIN